MRALRTSFATLAAVLVFLAPVAESQAQASSRSNATFILPEDFGAPSVGSGKGFEECDPNPVGGRYRCDFIELKNNERVLFTEPLDIEVRDDFQLEEGTSFNPDCFVTTIFVTNDKGFTLKKNGSFNGNIEVDKTVKIEENAVLNGDATSFEPNFDIVPPGRINGTCTPAAAGCGGVSQCAVPLALEKTPSSNVIGAGQRLTYTLDFSNEGNADVLGASVTDELPTGTGFVSATGGPDSTPPVGASGTITWSGDLSVGETSSVSVTVEVDPGTPNGTLLVNDALVSAPGAADAQDSATVLVESLPLLVLENTANTALVDPGGQITYTLTIENQGNATATNPVLTSMLDADTVFISATGGGTETAPGVVTWSAAEIESGSTTSVTLTVEVLDTTPRGTLLVNAGSVASDQTPPVDSDARVLVDVRPLLTLEKSSDKEVATPGDTLTFTLDYANRGSQVAESVVLTDTLPANTTFLSATGGGIETSPGVVTWGGSSSGDLLPGDEGSVQVTVEVDLPLANGTRLINRSNLVDESGARVAYSEITVPVGSRPVLNLLKTGDREVVAPGDIIEYTLVAANTGNAVANNLILEDAIPDNTIFLEASGNGRVAGNLVVWGIDQLLVNVPQVFKVRVEVASPLDDQTLLVNSAALLSVDQAVTSEFTSTVRSEAVLELTKIAVDVADPLTSINVAEPGDEIGYVLTVRNSGNAIARNLIIEDPIPENTSFVEASSGGLLVDGVVRWTIDSLAPGTVAQVGFGVCIGDYDRPAARCNLQPLEDGTRIYNVATADADATRAATGEAELFINSSPILELTKTVDKQVAQPDDLLTYTLAVRNTGNANALNPFLEDRIPTNTSFVSASGPFAFDGQVVRWTVPALNAGASGSVTLTVRVDTPLSDGTTINNSALLGAENAPSVTDEVGTQIESTAVLQLTKTADAERLQPGDSLTYFLTLENSGNATATDITLSDRVPQNTTFESASGGGVESGGVVRWNIGDLPPGPVTSVSMTVRIAGTLDDGTLLVNSALAGASNSAEVAAALELVVDSAPVLELTKVADRATVQPGEEITYRLEVEAAGNAIARNAQVLDVLPRNTTLVDAPGAVVDGRRITWDLGDLAPGDTSALLFVVRVDTPLDDRVIIRNLAVLTADDTNGRVAFTRTDVDSSPILSLTKESSAEFVSPGEQYAYSLDYSNTGNANAQGVTIEDTVPANTRFVSATGGGVLQGDRVVWDLGSLAAGTVGEVSATFEVAGPPLENGTVIGNTATLAASNGLSVTDDETVVVESAPALSLTKTADKGKVSPPETITYVLTARNDGNDTARNAVLEDPVPQNTTFVSATGGGTVSGGVVSWMLGDLLPGAESSVSMTVQLPPSLDNGTVIKNTGTLSADNGNSSTASAASTVISSVDLEIEKTVDAPVVMPGDTLTYTINYRNAGNANASGVTLADVLPANTTFVSATGNPTETGKTTEWSLGDLIVGDEGQVTLVVRVDSPLDNGTQITNTAVITEPGRDFDQARVTSVVASEPRLTLDKDASASVVEPGDEITYSLAVGNTGNASAKGLTLIDQIPQFTQVVSASPGAVISGDRVSWTFDSLVPGDVAAVSLTVLVDSPLANGTSIRNVALADAMNSSGVLAEAVSLVESSPVLALTKTASRDKVDPGAEIAYRFSYSNDGNDTATAVILEDTVPEFTAFVSASDGGTESGGTVTWNLGQLPPGESGEVTATFLVTGPPLADGTRISNVATINAAEASPVSDEALVIVSSAPLLTLDKSADRELVTPGDQVTFTIDFANEGSDTASNVVVTDTLPDNTTLVFASGDFTSSGDTLTWSFATLEPGVGGSLVLVLAVDSPLADGISLVNAAGINSDGTSPVADSASVRVQSQPFLSLEKTADVSATEPGGDIVYTLSYGNTGTADSLVTVLTDTLPSNTAFVSASAGGVFNGSTVSWNVGQLLAGSQGLVMLTVRVAGDAVNGDTVLNSATLDAQNATPANAALALGVSAAPQLRIDKLADREFAQAGEAVNYEISYSNTGNGAATSVTVSDSLPSNVNFVSAPGATVTGSTVSWDLGTVGPGETGVLTLAVTIDGGAAAGDEIVNRASISAVEAQPVVSPDAVVTVVDNGTGPILGVSIDGAPQLVRPGDEVTYTVGYSNSAAAPADDPRLIGLIPQGTVFVSASDGGVLRSQDGYTFVEWTVPTLPGGSAGTVSYVVRTLASGTSRLVSSSQPSSPAMRGLYSADSAVQASSTRSSQSALQTTRPLVAIAVINAANFSPPQVASSVVFLSIPNVSPTVVSLWFHWQLALLIALLLAVGARAVAGRGAPSVAHHATVRPHGGSGVTKSEGGCRGADRCADPLFAPNA